MEQGAGMIDSKELERIRLRCVCGEDGCWLWSGSVNGRGLPTLNRIVDGKTKNMSARRWVYTASGKTLYARDKLITSCEVRNCLNPEHLKRSNGSAIQRANNKRDPGLLVRRGIAVSATWRRKGRGAKLTAEQAEYARTSPLPSAEVGKELGVSGALVRYIRAGKVWRHTSPNPFAGLGA